MHFILAVLLSVALLPQGAPAGTDAALRAELLKMLQDDQRHRRELQQAARGEGDPHSPELLRLIEKQEALDQAAVAQLQRILDARGWPTAALVGRDARRAAFLVLQHAPIEVQEKYLPMARSAARQGELDLADLAMLEDRVLMRRGKPQRYGTQLHTEHATRALAVWPIDDEAGVDARRKSVGLEPLADYLRRFQIVYTPKVR